MDDKNADELTMQAFRNLDAKARRALARHAVKTLLLWVGDDITRPGLLETPDRVLDAWRDDWGRGYQENPAGHIKCFPDGEGSQMITVSDIQFYSTCEHHLAPFHGTATISYVPTDNGVVGLSKLARVVDGFARRLQVQERLTCQIADTLAERLSAHVGVMLHASHTCMCSRGVRQPNAMTTTTALRGNFYDNDQTRAEFLGAAKPR